ncbi:MAG TPA: SpoIIE family protein phosphatase [Blastocatellia bacterium]|jgi:serine phosphatase RsbU (regulator of sigma subunit)|nr:SpoIIE family protein phosphatase [Blastocatellia bacterium]
MSTLIVRPKDFEPSVVKLDKVRLTIGRSSRNDICIGDPFASRLHAEIVREGEQVLLVDNGSANGTFLNGQRVSGTIALQAGDLIRIGETEIEYTSSEQSMLSGATVFLSGSAAAQLPADTITTPIPGRSTRELLSTIQSGGMSAERRASSGARAAMAPEPPVRDLLSIVSQVGIALLPRTTLEDTLKITIDLVFQAIPAERGFLFLKEGEELICKIARGAHEGVLPTASQIQLSRSITSKVLREGEPVLTSDAMHDPRFQSQNSIVLSQIRSVMAVPLVSGEETFGMIYVDNPFNNRFTAEDLNVLTTVASVASIKIEHERLLEERLEKRRMEEELKVASEIQMRLQPVAPPKIPGWDMTAVSFPCREIGGDYYDFIQRKRDGSLVMAVGDVSGKGTGAALLMSSLHAAVRAQSQARSSISEVMGEINQYIFENSPPNKFLTLLYGELNTETGQLTYSNAGHNTPMLLRRSGEVVKLDRGGLPIGLMPGVAYQEDTVSFEPGDVLIIYSDGITESIDEKDEEFGETRLLDVVKNNLTRSASGIRDRIDEALSRFVGTTAPIDDMTLMIIRRCP